MSLLAGLSQQGDSISAHNADPAAHGVYRFPRHILFAGDSHTNGQNSTNLEINWSQKSFANQFAARCGGRYYMRRNAGTYGALSGAILTQLADELTNFKPQVVHLLLGTNDVMNAGWGSTYTVDTVLANVSAAIRAVLAAGAEPWVATLPYSVPAKQSGFDSVNVGIKRLAALYGCKLNDVAAVVNDPATGYMLAGYSDDNLHFNVTAAIAVANAMVAADTYSAAPSFLPVAQVESWNQITTNALFLTDTNADGIPDGWTSTGASGTVVYSRTLDARGFYWANMSRLGSTNIVFSNTPAAPAFTVGSRIAFGARVKQTALDSSFAAFLVLKFLGPGTSFMVALAPVGGNLDEAVEYFECVVPAATTGLQMFAYLSAGTGTLSIAQPFILNKA